MCERLELEDSPNRSPCIVSGALSPRNQKEMKKNRALRSKGRNNKI